MTEPLGSGEIFLLEKDLKWEGGESFTQKTENGDTTGTFSLGAANGKQGYTSYDRALHPVSFM